MTGLLPSATLKALAVCLVRILVRKNQPDAREQTGVPVPIGRWIEVHEGRNLATGGDRSNVGAWPRRHRFACGRRVVAIQGTWPC